MTAAIFSFVVGFSLGLGLGVVGVFYILWKRGHFRFDPSDFKVGGSD